MAITDEGDLQKCKLPKVLLAVLNLEVPFAGTETSIDLSY